MTNRNSTSAVLRAPVNLMAVALDDCQVMLVWTECGTGGLGFRVERADGIGSCSPFVEIGGVGPHVAGFRDGSAKPRTTHSYRVHAWNATEDSPPSNVVEVTIPAEMEVAADNDESAPGSRDTVAEDASDQGIHAGPRTRLTAVGVSG